MLCTRRRSVVLRLTTMGKIEMTCCLTHCRFQSPITMCELLKMTNYCLMFKLMCMTNERFQWSNVCNIMSNSSWWLSLHHVLFNFSWRPSIHPIHQRGCCHLMGLVDTTSDHQGLCIICGRRSLALMQPLLLVSLSFLHALPSLCRKRLGCSALQHSTNTTHQPQTTHKPMVPAHACS